MKCKNCGAETPQGNLKNSSKRKNKSLKYLEETSSDNLDNIYLKCLLRAIRNINSKEVYTEHKIEERNFVTYLFLHIRCLLCEKGIKIGSIPLITIENNKIIHSDEYDNNDIDSFKETAKHFNIDIENNSFSCQPDLIIHEEHNSKNLTTDRQHLIIEAKTKTYGKKKFDKDFFKLNSYISKLMFRNAVFLSIGKPVEKIETLIKSYIDKGYYISNEYKRIYFVICPDAENFNKDIAVYTLNKDLSTN